MEKSGLEIIDATMRLCAYTAKEAGVAVLAHTDAGTADLFVEGKEHTGILTNSSPSGPFLRLRSRSAGYYLFFDLLGPITPDLFIEMGELYTRLVQTRLSPKQMEELLKREGC